MQKDPFAELQKGLLTSIMPHRSLQFTSVHSISDAAHYMIGLLYGDLPVELPRSFKDRTRRNRNHELIERFQAGESVPVLAREFGISQQRVHQILKDKRN